ncbi:MAG: TolC family protein [Alistipes sp.]|nr:TolC family protein [Alistipes sp.]MBR0330806.1 TolC family protein [Alistipes sp.]
MTLLALVCVGTSPVVAQQQGIEPRTVAAQNGPLMLTLDQALSIALEENPTVRIADQTIEVKKYAKRGTYAALWPEISASATYQRYVKKQMFHFQGNTIEVGTTNNASGGIQAAMPLVNFQLWKSLKLSAMDVELAVEQARSSRIDMVEQVSKTFYQVLMAKDAYNVYKRVYDNAVENHKIVEKKYNVGAVSEYDFIRSQVTVSNAEPNVLNAENSIVLALWQLKALLGMDLSLDIDCAGSLADYESVMTEIYKANKDLTNNSTLRQLDIQERMLNQTLKVQRAANMPSLALTANYTYTALDETLKIQHYRWNPYSVVGLSLNVPIFAGGKRRADINQAKLNLNNLELQRENVERQLMTALMQYESNMQTNLKEYYASSQNISQAKRGYDIAVKRYEIGGGTLVDVDNSQLAYTQAELSRSTAIFNYLVNRVSIDKILGDNAFAEYTEQK